MHPNGKFFSLRQCTISYHGFFFHPIYSINDKQFNNAGSGEGSADGSEDVEGSGYNGSVRDQSPICLDKRINVSVERDGDKIYVSYRAFRFRTPKQGPRDKWTHHFPNLDVFHSEQYNTCTQNGLHRCW